MNTLVTQPPDISVTDLVRFLRRGLLLALAVGLLLAGLAYGLSLLVSPSYRAEGSVLAAERAADGAGTTLRTTSTLLGAEIYREAALSNPVLEEALGRLEQRVTPRALEHLRDDLTVTTEENRRSTSVLIRYRARGATPTEAAERANAAASSLVAWEGARATQTLRNLVLDLEGQVAALDTRLASLAAEGEGAGSVPYTSLLALRAQQATQLELTRALLDSPLGLLDVLEPAAPPTEPAFPRPLLNAAVAFILGLFGVYGALALRDALNTRVRDSEDLARVSGLPVLGEFAKQASGRRLPGERAGYLRTNLLFATTAEPRVILVTSPQSSEGKSSVALSTAESFARNGFRTLLVDADLRKPVLAGEYGVRPPQAGLQDLLENLHEDYRPLEVSPNLHLVPSFKPAPAPAELLSFGFRERLNEWRERYDVIIIDSAPVLPVADTLVIAPQCSGVLLAASPGSSDQRHVRAAVELFGRVGVPVLGAVATSLSPAGFSSAGGYGYGYGYGDAPSIAPAVPAPQVPQPTSHESKTGDVPK